MKKLIPIFVFFIASLSGYAQTTELSARLNTGFFYFSGESVNSTTLIWYDLSKEVVKPIKPFGDQHTPSFGLSVNLNRVTKSRFRFGIDAGFEVLRSKTSVNEVALTDGINSTFEAAQGRIITNYSFLNFNPHIGYRLKIKSFNVDFDLGIEIAYGLSSVDRGKVNTNARTLNFEWGRKTIKTDYRERYQLTISKNKIGAYIGISGGVENYHPRVIGGPYGALSRMIRFGLIYQLK